MLKQTKIASIWSLSEKALLFRILLLIILLLTLFIDNLTQKPMGALYIIVMIIAGFAFKQIKTLLLLSGILTCIYFYLHQKNFLEWDILLYEWTSFFFISFSIRTLLQKYKNQKFNVIQLTTVLAKALDSRDAYTANHSENVARYSKMIAEEMGYTKNQLEDLYYGGLLHDIGKIGIPEAVLTKPGRLTDAEFEQIKRHPEIGYNILKEVSSFREKGILDIVLYHHERVDGNGYPKGLKGEEIPLNARIVSLADAYDAMTTNRTYRDKQNIEFAIAEIKKSKGKQFDEEVVDVFLNLIAKQKLKSENLEERVL